MDNPYASPETLDTSPPGGAWVQGNSPELARTGQGLSLVYFGICLILFSVLSALFGFVFTPLALLSWLGVMLGALMMTIGPLFCLSVPEATGARSLIVTSVVLQFVYLATVMLGIFAAMPFPAVAGAVMQLVWFSAMVLFVLFLRSLAQFIGRHDLAARARNVLFLGVISLSMFLLITVFESSLSPLFFLGGEMLMVIFGIAGIMALVAFVMYANLLNALRKSLRMTQVEPP